MFETTNQIYIYTMGSNKYKHPMMGIPIDSWKILTIPIMGNYIEMFMI
jgi:hypothetical protein